MVQTRSLNSKGNTQCTHWHIVVVNDSVFSFMLVCKQFAMWNQY